MALVATSMPVFGDTLASGSVYFDSQKTLEEVVKLSAEKDNEGILKLINNGHVSQQTDSEKEIIVLTAGFTPESAAQFRFPTAPTTYWTLAKFVNKADESAPTMGLPPSLAPTPSPAPTSTPELEESPSPTPKKQQSSESESPFDDDNGRRIWHKVDGKWKWYPAGKHHVPSKKASPSARKTLPPE